MLYIAKVMTSLGKKVLLVDTTVNQKARYIVPVINPTKSYITEFEGIDVAVGFNSVDDIKNYIGITEELPYDIMLMDIDTPERVNNFHLDMADKSYFVTSFDIFSLRRGVEILRAVQVPINLKKILFAKEILKEEDDYLNLLALGCKVMWEEERIYFPFENGDLSVIAENQRVQKIKFKKLSVQYKDSLSFITQEILDHDNDSSVRKAMKIIERGV